MKRDLNIMIKPSSSKCNLRCKYCFYHSIANARDVKDYGFMKEEILEEIVKKAIDYCGSGVCTLGFQGGESLLIGLNFYKKLIYYVKKYNVHTKFNYSIQTNGTLLNEEWAAFFKENHFLVGISLDGTKDVHNLNRTDSMGEGSFNKVMKAVSLLKKHAVDFNVLVVVTSSLCKKIESSYNFFKKNDIRYLQFIPCLDPLEDISSSANSYSLSPELYGGFLKKTFDLWYSDIISGNPISIRYFDNILGLFLGYDYEACDMRGTCSCQHIIEADGSVYPCDFYTYEKYRIGNIVSESFDNLHANDKTIKFIEASTNVNIECNSCRYNAICRGGCRRHRDTQKENINIFCTSYKEFLDEKLNYFKVLAQKLK